MKRYMTAQDLAEFRTASDPQISPDGSRAAFVVKTMEVAENRYTTHIWVTGVQGTSPESGVGAAPWTGGTNSDSLPRWSLDGVTLAFVGRRETPGDQVFVVTNGGEPRPVTDLEPGRISEVAWAPDGSRIAFRFRPQADDWTDAAAEERRLARRSQPPREITRLRYRAEGEGYLTDFGYARLRVVDLSTGMARTITPEDRDCGSFCWSPDGTQIAYAVNASAAPDLMPKAEGINVVVIETPAVVTYLDVPLGPKSGLAWSPDGTRIAYLGHTDASEVWDVRNMHPWVTTLTGSARDLIPASDLHFGNVSLSDLAGSGSCGPHWLPDGKGLLALAAEAGTMTLWRIAVHDGTATRILGSGDQSVLAITLDTDGETAALLVGGPSLPSEVTLHQLGGRPAARTRLNDVSLRCLKLSVPVAFEAQSLEGHTVHCWACFPPQGTMSGPPLPAILSLHGGPQMMHLGVLSHEMQMLAAQGYVVLTLDPRGSKGYGEAWTLALKGKWGAPAYADAMACVDHAVAQGWVDADRMGVMGGSYGGYLTAFILGKTGRFRAAVAERGIYNLISMAGTSDMPWVDHGYFPANVSGDPEAYLVNSPLTYANDIHTPLLLIHGEGDRRCAIEQSEQLFAALKRQGKEAVFVRYGPEASHGFSRVGPPDLRLDRLERIRVWFNSRLHP